MLKTEESRIAIVILFTFALLLITGVYPQYVLVMTSVMVAGGIVLGIYLWLTGKKEGERQDERSERCSLMASRNGFLVSIVLMALLAVALKLGSPLSTFEMIQIIWGLGMATYLLSYLYYKRVV
jgi:uncharacterized membrane protein